MVDAWCSIHNKAKAGFGQLLFCGDCEAEGTTSKHKTVAPGIAKGSDGDLSKLDRGDEITLAGKVFARIHATDRSGSKYVCFDIIIGERPVRCTIPSDDVKLYNRFSNYGPSGKIVYVTGTVRHNVEHADHLCSDIRVTDLKF